MGRNLSEGNKPEGDKATARTITTIPGLLAPPSFSSSSSSSYSSSSSTAGVVPPSPSAPCQLNGHGGGFLFFEVSSSPTMHTTPLRAFWS